MTVEYLFEPCQVSKALLEYKHIRDKMGEPEKEGNPAVTFSNARKTGREIYRILSNQHYTHLQELLSALDLCLNEGWEQPKILKTRSGKEFDSTIAELLVTSHFIKLGFRVSSFEQQKEQESVPDGLAQGTGISCCYEVYAPRDWDGFELFMEDLRLYTIHLDTPWDFHFEISMKSINHFDEEGRIVWFNPWQFSDAYETPAARADKIEPLVSEIDAKLQTAGGKKFRVVLPDDSHNVVTILFIDTIQTSQSATPIRGGSLSGPTLTGYAPESMFDRLIQTRIKKKIGKKQTSTRGGVSINALFVDISHLGYQAEFRNPIYKKKFQESIGSHLDLNSTETDIVLFYYPNRSQPTGIEVPILTKRTAIRDVDIKSLLGEEPLRGSICISP